jgi:hypothetical protein
VVVLLVLLVLLVFLVLVVSDSMVVLLVRLVRLVSLVVLAEVSVVVSVSKVILVLVVQVFINKEDLLVSVLIILASFALVPCSTVEVLAMVVVAALEVLITLFRISSLLRVRVQRKVIGKHTSLRLVPSLLSHGLRFIPSWRRLLSVIRLNFLTGISIP